MCRSIDDLKTLKSDDITNRERVESRIKAYLYLVVY